MYKTYRVLFIVALPFLLAVLNSCKKNGPEDLTTIQVSYCNTAPDCEAVGTYRVRASYFVTSGPNVVFDTIYPSTIITITERSSGVVEFKDTALLHQQFDASYDSTESLFGWSAFTSYNNQTYGQNKISNYGPDSIQVSITTFISAAGREYTYWQGARIH